MSKPFLERAKGKYVVAPNGCWIWTAGHTKVGYGITTIGMKKELAHRAMYEAMIGPIPEGMVVDHLCSNPPCVCPAHLEAVTQAENLRRGRSHQWKLERTHCRNNHEYTEENTRIYVRPSGRVSRICRACERRSS